MTPAAFRAEQDRLGLTQGQMGVLLGVRDRTVRLWLAEDSVPRTVALLLPRLSKAEAKRLLKEPAA